MPRGLRGPLQRAPDCRPSEHNDSSAASVLTGERQQIWKCPAER